MGRNSKYFYKGISLSNYCKKNGIAYKAIKYKIDSLKKDETYRDYTDEEIIKFAIESVKNGKSYNYSYLYHGVPLSQYCRDNNLNYMTIMQRIHRLKSDSKYREYSNDELAQIAIESKQNDYFIYENISLKEYCKINRISYKQIKNRISRLKAHERYKGYSDEELIKLALEFSSGKVTSKYFYNNIPLKQYCQENNINYRTIITKIAFLRKKDEYRDYTNDEIVKIIIETMTLKTKNKYYYQGILLKQYCELNNLSYQRIILKINSLKKQEEYANQSIEEIIKIAIELKPLKKRNIYYYKGIALVQYCNDKKIDYSTIVKKINKLKRLEQFKDYSDEEIVKLVFEGYTSSKYNYKGMTLRQYCIKNNLNYNGIVKKINVLKKIEKYKKYTNNELVKLVIETNLYENRNEYYYNGISLKQYCEENNLNYNYIKNKINKLKKNENYREYSNEELVKLEIISVSKKKRVKHYYKGVPLKQYCMENNIYYQTILQRINKLKMYEQFKDYSEDEIITLAIENCMPNKKYKNSIYLYKGIPLNKYCLDNNLNYRTIVERIYQLKNDERYTNYSNDQLVKLAIETQEWKNRNRTVNYTYLYKGIPLIKYCEQHDIKYTTIMQRIHKMENEERYVNYNNDQLVETAIIEYKKYHNINEFMNFLKYSNLTEKEIKFIYLIFKKNKNYEELANIFNTDVESIKRKEKEIIIKLKRTQMK